MSDTEKTEQALATSVIVMDTSRRVGWAKHFASESKLDDALRDLNVTRSERDMYREALSFLVGVMDQYTAVVDDQHRMKLAMELYSRYEVVLDDKVRASGRRVGDKIARQRSQAARRASGRTRKIQWDEVKLSVMRWVAAEAGCRDIDELVERLAQLQATAYRQEATRRAEPRSA